MRYVLVEEVDPFATLLGFAILALIAWWEAQSLLVMLPGIFAFLVSTYVLCSLIIRLARRMGAAARLDEVREVGINPFASIRRAVDAFASALPDSYARVFERPSGAAFDALLAAGLGGLLAFGLTCSVSGALTAWQRTGHWSPTMPLVAAAVGAAMGSSLAKAARGWLDRAHPRRPDLNLLDHRQYDAVDPTFRYTGQTADEPE